MNIYDQINIYNSILCGLDFGKILELEEYFLSPACYKMNFIIL